MPLYNVRRYLKRRKQKLQKFQRKQKKTHLFRLISSNGRGENKSTTDHHWQVILQKHEWLRCLTYTLIHFIRSTITLWQGKNKTSFICFASFFYLNGCVLLASREATMAVIFWNSRQIKQKEKRGEVKCMCQRARIYYRSTC